jgi:hypothetical protein
MRHKKAIPKTLEVKAEEAFLPENDPPAKQKTLSEMVAFSSFCVATLLSLTTATGYLYLEGYLSALGHSNSQFNWSLQVYIFQVFIMALRLVVSISENLSSVAIPFIVAACALLIGTWLMSSKARFRRKSVITSGASKSASHSDLTNNVKIGLTNVLLMALSLIVTPIGLMALLLTLTMPYLLVTVNANDDVAEFYRAGGCHAESQNRTLLAKCVKIKDGPSSESKDIAEGFLLAASEKSVLLLVQKVTIAPSTNQKATEYHIDHIQLKDNLVVRRQVDRKHLMDRPKR